MDREKPFKNVGTHHGRFHADEVMGTSILKKIFDVEVVRTRKSEVLEKLDIVYDVGGGKFDHHDLDKKYRENGIPYASCGLLWKEFGYDVIKSVKPSLSDDDIFTVFKSVDSTLIQGIDAVDNGLKTGEVDIPTMNISSIISGFNPPWDSEMSEDLAFNDAVKFASEILDNTLNQKFSVLSARCTVGKAYMERPRNEVIVLDIYCPWSQALRNLDDRKEVLYVVYPGRDGYTIQTIRKKASTLKARKDLPKSWAGKRDEELGDIIGIDDAVFCHPGRFIAGAKSYESIIKMADIAIAEPRDNFVMRIIDTIKRFLIKD